MNCNKSMIDRMVDRFLSWKLPADFSPDGGISFTKDAPYSNAHYPPTGTNLFTAEQARGMFEYVISDNPEENLLRGKYSQAYHWRPADEHKGETDASPVATAPMLLNDARNIMVERGKQYDSPEGERSMAKTIQAFNAITGNNLSEADGWLFMATLKSVRLFSVRDKTHDDSVKDLIAYTALLGECGLQKGDLK